MACHQNDKCGNLAWNLVFGHIPLWTSQNVKRPKHAGYANFHHAGPTTPMVVFSRAGGDNAIVGWRKYGEEPGANAPSGQRPNATQSKARIPVPPKSHSCQPPHYLHHVN
jgi:hypothetical protein